MNSENSLFKVKEGSRPLKLKVPTSKSYANRMLILAALDKNDVLLEDLPGSTDVVRMLNAFESIGLKVERDGDNAKISGSFPECEKEIDKPLVIESGDGGTTNRFLIPLLCRGRREYRVEAKGKMRERPMEALAKTLKEMDVQVTRDKDIWFSVRGKAATKGRYKVDCSETTQFITGLCLAFADTECEFIPDGMDSSRAYFEMTESLIGNFRNGTLSWRVPPDFSGLGYPLAYGLTQADVEITNGREADHLQADSIFLKLAEEMGAKLDFSNGMKISRPPKLNPIKVDGSEFPDLIPTLAYVCSYADGDSILSNLGVLRHKESDRVEETLKLLRTFEVEHEYDKKTETLVIRGPAEKCGVKEATPPDDHRMVMVSWLYLKKNAGGTLTNAGHVAKSFPDFLVSMEGKQ